MWVFAYDNRVSFEKSVGLVARQKELVGDFVGLYRVTLRDFPRVPEFWVIGVGHFAQSE